MSETIKLEFSGIQMDALFLALYKAPYEVSAPFIDELKRQIAEQQKDNSDAV